MKKDLLLAITAIWRGQINMAECNQSQGWDFICI